MLAKRREAATKAITVRCCMVETCWKRIGFRTTIQAFPSELQSSSITRKEIEVSETAHNIKIKFHIIEGIQYMMHDARTFDL
jgi:hypothetical protein